MYKSQAKNLETEMNQMISQLKELQDNLEKEGLARKESENLVKVYESKMLDLDNEKKVELVSKELNHLAAILHVYAGGLNFMN